MTYALRIASRRRRGGVASSKPRHSVATSGSHSRQRKRATVTSSKRRHGAKHPPTGQGLARKTSRRVESLEREESRNAPQARRRRRRKPLRHIGGFKPPADLPAALRKEFTATALKGVVERFAQCSSEKLPLVKLLGKELATNLATVILGKNSPWLGLVDDTAGSPKLKALDDLSSQWSVLNVGKDVQQQLNVFTQFQINVAEFKQLATADTIKQAEQDLEKAGMVEGKSIDTYVRENVAKWDSMHSGLQGSVDKVVAIAEKAKAGLSSDLLQFFEHAKEQASISTTESAQHFPTVDCCVGNTLYARLFA
ncbi:hypothetical protein HPB49_017105 [Dermacentor silvarum]|uniref:Uncharacterized protein n=1 Tax=Dermacentor silvarum TaxID=543639 RepID=A0ACB8CRZ4_DERSI|nr:hypothetical protein HPB49_017105 [Dermacentor silvarum]